MFPSTFGPRRSELARNSFVIILCRIVARLSIMFLINLESFVVPLTMICKIHKNNRNKTNTCLEGLGAQGPEEFRVNK